MVRSTTVSAVAVLDLHDQLLNLGVVTATQLREAGVEGAKLLDQGAAASPIQEQRVDETQLLALWQFAANNTQLPHIGLLIGQTFNPATHGVLASLVAPMQSGERGAGSVPAAYRADEPFGELAVQ